MPIDDSRASLAERKCVVVLGPGRSGTSLCMKLLHSAGMDISTDLVPASEHNPPGHFEDVRIRDAQQGLLESLRWSPYVLRPDGWKTSPQYEPTRARLAAVLHQEVGRAHRVWGFKDPRTCVLWPMWQEIFREEAATRPAVVYSVRSSGPVITSMMKSYSLPQDVAEGIFFLRTFHALRDVDEGWFFVHYRDWADEPKDRLRRLAAHCGLEDARADYAAAVAANYRPELNRQRADDALQLSGIIRETDALLASFSGTDYDQGAIDSWCDGVERRFDDLRFVFDGVGRRLTDRTPQAGWLERLAGAIGRLRR